MASAAAATWRSGRGPPVVTRGPFGGRGAFRGRPGGGSEPRSRGAHHRRPCAAPRAGIPQNWPALSPHPARDEALRKEYGLDLTAGGSRNPVSCWTPFHARDSIPRTSSAPRAACGGRRRRIPPRPRFRLVQFCERWPRRRRHRTGDPRPAAGLGLDAVGVRDVQHAAGSEMATRWRWVLTAAQ